MKLIKFNMLSLLLVLVGCDGGASGAFVSDLDSRPGQDDDIDSLVVSVRIESDIDYVRIGDIIDLRLIATMNNEELIDITQDSSVTWSSDSTTVISNGNPGVFIGQDFGDGEVIARFENLEDTKMISVIPDTLAYSWGDTFLNTGPDFVYNIDQIYSASNTYIAINNEGEIVGAWGGDSTTREYPQDITSPITNVFSTSETFAVIDENKDVYSWGAQMNNYEPGLVKNVKNIVSSDCAFTALTTDGTIVSWGASTCGGDNSFAKDYIEQNDLIVSEVLANSIAFIAITENGEAISWGHPDFGGEAYFQNVVTVIPTGSAFYSLDSSGDWHDTRLSGGISPNDPNNGEVKTIDELFIGSHATAVLNTDGTVATMGIDSVGGDSSLVQARLNNIIDIANTLYAFAALNSNGQVVTWGHPSYGGVIPDSTKIDLEREKIVSLHSTTWGAFAALNSKGEVIVWGNDTAGGSSDRLTKPLTNVKEIYSNDWAFVALKEDLTTTTWGTYNYYRERYEDNQDSDVHDNVQNIIPSSTSFTAIYAPK